MKIKHNKKRNVGLVFDQLSRLLSESIIRDDTVVANKCSAIISEHFKKGTALHDEMRLFRSLSEVIIKNDSLILKILDKSRLAAKRIDSKQLSREKTSLIKSLNKTFGKNEVFDKKNNRFRTLATIQVLLNEWRKDEATATISMLEDKLISEIKGLDRKIDVQSDSSDLSSVTSLVVEIAKKKFFQKHKSLSNSQVKMLFEMITADKVTNRKITKNIASSTLKELDTYINRESNHQSEYFVDSLKEASRKIKETDFESLDTDQIIGRALAMKKLSEELNNE